MAIKVKASSDIFNHLSYEALTFIFCLSFRDIICLMSTASFCSDICLLCRTQC